MTRSTSPLPDELAHLKPLLPLLPQKANGVGACRRMLSNPLNRALVAKLQARGPLPTNALLPILQAHGHVQTNQLWVLLNAGVLTNTTPGRHGTIATVWALGPRAALFGCSLEQFNQLVVGLRSVKPTCAKAAPAEQPVPPRWVGKAVPPRQYDVMHAPVYVPPPELRRNACALRPDANDHRQAKSQGLRC